METMTSTQTRSDLAIWWADFQTLGGLAVRDKLVLHYLPLVKYVVGRMLSHLPSHLSRDDLINTGILGLIKAVERFDPDRQIKFETYAIHRIKGAILDELRSLDLVPRSVRDKIREVQTAIRELEATLGRSPHEEEIAEKLQLTVDAYRDVLKKLSVIRFYSLSDMLDKQMDLASQDQLVAGVANTEARSENSERQRLLVEALQELSRNERLVVTLYYYEEMTMREIGAVLNVTESRVSQIHTQALLKLRGAVESVMQRWG